MAKVTFTDKVNVRTSATPAINKVADTDLNELKASTNALYDVTGWANYADSVASNIVLTTTPQLITIDALGGGTNEAYEPREIRGVSSLWTDNKISPIRIGDTYDFRFDFTIAAKSGSPLRIVFVLDIGGLATPTINVAERTLTAEKSAPFSTNFSFPIFTLATFIANGGQIFASVDTGTATLTSRAIFIKRTHSEV